MEGMAVVISRTREPDKYRVRFRTVRDEGVFERFVYDGEQQTDPVAYLARYSHI
jgi:hypothetical protein